MTLWRWLAIAGILLLTILLYSRVTLANYCGFDDMLELERLDFQDLGTLSHDMGTVLFNSYKYRPLSFTLNRITYRLGNEQALAFRVRNLLAHLLILLVLYGLGLELFNSHTVSATAALLFGLHPLANQPVVATIWVIVPANLGLLLSTLLFVKALKAVRFRLVLLIAAMLVAAISILVYDPVIVVMGIFYLYLWVRIVLKGIRSLDRRFIAVFVGLTVLFAAGWLSLRARYLPHGTQTMVKMPLIARNFVIYMAGPVQFIDPVLANEYLDTPLPPEALYGEVTPEWLAVTILPAFGFVLLFLWRMPRVRQSMSREDLVHIVFLLLVWAGSLTPYLFFNGHPSETYTYVGLMMLILLFSRLLYGAFIRKTGGFHRTAYLCLILSLAVLYGSATWIKNRRVRECGDTVTTIWTELPASLASGPRKILLANVPGEPATRPYGMYGYKGIDTLGLGVYGGPGVQCGVQHAFHNQLLSAQAVNADQLRAMCSSDTVDSPLCFWVHADGGILPASPSPASGQAPVK